MIPYLKISLLAEIYLQIPPPTAKPMLMALLWSFAQSCEKFELVGIHFPKLRSNKALIL